MRAATLASLTRAFAPTWVSRPSTPVRAVVAVTHRCNLRCESCASWTFPPRDELRPDEYRRLFSAMPELVWLDLTGGEPFGRRDIAEVFDAVLSSTPRLRVLHFPTNGWFTERVVEVARSVRATRPEVELLVTLSLDGDEELHDRLRGRKGSYRKVVETWHALADVEGVERYVGTTLSDANEDAMGDLEVQLHQDLEGFTDSAWHWNLYQVSGHFFGNTDSPVQEPARDVARVRRHLERRWPPRGWVDLMEVAFLVNLQARLSGEPLDLTCQSLASSCFVSPEGRLYPCHVWDRPLVDLREVDFDLARVWASESTRSVRGEVEALACGGCFTPCEAYPTLVGSPVQATRKTVRRMASWMAGRRGSPAG